MTTGKRIVRNASALLVSQAVTWLLAFSLTIVLPRYLGAEALGKLSLASSLWAIASIGVTFGLDALLVKLIARHPERTGELVGNAIVLRTALFVVALGLMSVYARVAGYPAETVRIIYIIGLSTLVWNWIGAVQSGLQGLEEMKYMSVGNVVGKGVVTLLCIPLVLLGQGLAAIAGAYLVSAVAALLIQLYYLNRLHRTRLSFQPRQTAQLMRDGLPHLFSSAFQVVYAQVHVIIIASLVNERTVGWFGTSSTLFGTLLFIPTVFTAAVSPTLSRFALASREEMIRLMRRSFDLLLVLSVPIGMGVLVVADPVVALLFGPDFTGSGPVLAIMGIALIFTYQNMLIGQFLISTDRQNVFTVVMAVATVSAILLDLVVVPWTEQRYQNGAIGAALSLLVSEAGMLAFALVALPKGSLGQANVRTALKVLLAGGIMVGATWWARPYFVGVPIVIGAVTYTVAVLGLRAIPAEDLGLVRSLAGRLVARVTG